MAGVWPIADPFDWQSPVYGDRLIGYLGAPPNLTTYSPGRIHDGYGEGSAAAATTTADRAYGAMRREVFVEDVIVTLASRKAIASGTIDAAQLERHGVLARIQGGTLVQPSNPDQATVHYHSFDAYGLLVVRQGAGPDVRIQIVRFNAGVMTVLEETGDLAVPGSALAADFTLRLSVQTVAGDVVLTAYTDNLPSDPPVSEVGVAPGGGGGGPTPTLGLAREGFFKTKPAPTPAGGGGTLYKFGSTPLSAVALTVTDDSVNKITGAGRCGFILDGERDYSGNESVSLASVFEVADFDSGTVLWRDEWKRAQAKLGEDVVDAFGTAGNNLASDFNGDRASELGHQATNTLKRDGAEEAVVYSPNVIFQAGLHLRPVGNLVQQRRTVDAKLADTTASAGLLVRGKVGPSDLTGILPTGYWLRVRAGTPATIVLNRVKQGAVTKLAEAGVGGPNISTGTWFEISLEAHQTDSGGLEGPVTLIGEIDGTPIPWDVSDGAGFIDLDGNVLDLEDDRLLSGNVCGLVTATTTTDVLYDNFTVATPEGTSGANAADYESLAMPGEADEAFGDLNEILQPDWDVQRIELGVRKDVAYYSGHQQRYAVRTYRRRRFRCVKRSATDAEILALREFWDDHDGWVKGFGFDPTIPGDLPGVFHFLGSRIEDGYQNNARVTSFDLEELRS